MDEAAALAKSTRGAMVAAAGCGKTHIIAKAVAEHSRGKDLVLTHTHAGVEAIRRRLAKICVTPTAAQVDTIAGWALRLAAAFPSTSELPNVKPRNSAEYSTVYVAASQLLGLRPIQEIIRASYSGVYVDEYQDCTIDQHELVVALLDILPCRIVGDPLQGIFDFGDNKAIQWDEHVGSSFEEVPGPTTPWRWTNSNPGLGAWLIDVRKKLAAGQGVNLQGTPVRWLDGSDPKWRRSRQLAACFAAAGNDGESVIAIHKWSHQCHAVASRLKGAFSCVEAIDTKDLYDFADLIDTKNGFARAVAVLDFAAKCMTKVKTELRTIREALDKSRVPAVRRYTAQLNALLVVRDDDSLAGVRLALQAIRQVPGTVVYRRELLHEMERAVVAVLSGEAGGLTDAAWLVRNRSRKLGRLLSRCAVGTTLLVKGLEFDHVVLLDADAHDAKNLYVALTRASKSLTIVSGSQLIVPHSN